MTKLNIGPNVFTQTMPVTLLGSEIDGKPNFMTLAWVTRVNGNPPLFGVSVNKFHLTNKGIKENQTFSLNFPSEEMIKETDFCGLVSGKKTDKSEVFSVFYGIIGTAPMIVECPLTVECRLVDVLELPSHDLFIGESIEAYTEPQYLTDGKPDVKKIKPLSLTMPDNNYWKVGEHAGNAWSEGKNYKIE